MIVRVEALEDFYFVHSLEQKRPEAVKWAVVFDERDRMRCITMVGLDDVRAVKLGEVRLVDSKWRRVSTERTSRSSVQ